MDFVGFVTAKQAMLLGLAAALSGDASAADDIVADVLGRVYERWGRSSGLERVDAYVLRMVVNEFLSRQRRQRRIVLTAEWDDHAVIGPDPAGDYVERQAMKARITRLPRRQRAALVLRYHEGLSDPELAETIGHFCGLGDSSFELRNGRGRDVLVADGDRGRPGLDREVAAPDSQRGHHVGVQKVGDS